MDPEHWTMYLKSCKQQGRSLIEAEMELQEELSEYGLDIAQIWTNHNSHLHRVSGKGRCARYTKSALHPN